MLQCSEQVRPLDSGTARSRPLPAPGHCGDASYASASSTGCASDINSKLQTAAAAYLPDSTSDRKMLAYRMGAFMDLISTI
jgi:hypothetical protein